MCRKAPAPIAGQEGLPVLLFGPRKLVDLVPYLQQEGFVAIGQYAFLMQRVDERAERDVRAECRLAASLSVIDCPAGSFLPLLGHALHSLNGQATRRPCSRRVSSLTRTAS